VTRLPDPWATCPHEQEASEPEPGDDGEEFRHGRRCLCPDCTDATYDDLRDREA